MWVYRICYPCVKSESLGVYNIIIYLDIMYIVIIILYYTSIRIVSKYEKYSKDYPSDAEISLIKKTKIITFCKTVGFY